MTSRVRSRLRRSGSVGESGMATVEFAIALPAVVIVVTLVVSLAQLLLTHHRTWNAASVAARAAARGEGDDGVRNAVAATGVPATLTVARNGGWVTVSLVARPPTPLGWVLPDVNARAVAAQENTGDAAINRVGGTAGADRAEQIGGSAEVGDPGGRVAAMTAER